jgi:hypothetical protein
MLATFMIKMVGCCLSIVSNLRVKVERHPHKHAESNDVKGKVAVPVV